MLPVASDEIRDKHEGGEDLIRQQRPASTAALSYSGKNSEIMRPDIRSKIPATHTAPYNLKKENTGGGISAYYKP